MNELSELVQRRLLDLGEGGRALSYERAANRSHGMVSDELIRRIVIGKHSGRISDRTAQGLALALEVPVAQVYAAAKIPRPQSRWQWPSRFDRLDSEQRDLIEKLAAALLESYEKGLRDA